MAVITYKNLGQVTPVAGTLTTLYTTPTPSGSTVVSSVFVTNTSSSKVVFRLSHAINGAADTLAQYLYYDAVLGPNQTFVATVGATMGPGDVLRCQANNPLVSFNAYGAEYTA